MYCFYGMGICLNNNKNNKIIRYYFRCYTIPVVDADGAPDGRVPRVVELWPWPQ